MGTYTTATVIINMSLLLKGETTQIILETWNKIKNLSLITQILNRHSQIQMLAAVAPSWEKEEKPNKLFNPLLAVRTNIIMLKLKF